MPDICDLILDQHDELRRRFAELDARRGDAAAEQLWSRVATQLELHASAEEEVFYPHLLEVGRRAGGETRDALEDHNAIRDAIRRAGAAEACSPSWWTCVDEAREQNSAHLAEEERGALADFRRNADEDERSRLGARWLDFVERHAGGADLDARDVEPERYLEEHRRRAS